MDTPPTITADTPLILEPIKPVCGACNPLGILRTTSPTTYRKLTDYAKMLVRKGLANLGDTHE